MSDSLIQNIRFTSIDATGAQFRKLKLGPQDFNNALSETFALSETKTLRLTQGILTTIKTNKQFAVEAPAIVSWAQGAGSGERQLVTRAFLKHSGGDLYLVHQMAQMPRAKTAIFMKDFREAGGDLKAVMEWLRLAGGVLNDLQVKPQDTDGVALDLGKDIYNGIKKKAEDTVDAVAEAVASVVNAVGNTAAALKDMVGMVVTWTVDKVRDVLVALMNAGKKVGDIMSAALQNGIAALKTFVSALMSVAGKPIGDLLKWMQNQVAKAGQAVVQTLLQTLTVGSLLKLAFDFPASIAQQVMQTMMDLGNSIGDLLKGALQNALDTFRTAFKTLLDMGRSIAKVLADALKQSLELFEKGISFLVALGRTLAEILEAISSAGLAALKAGIKFLVKETQGLIDVAQWAAGKGLGLLRDTVRIMFEIGIKLGDLLTDIAVGAVHLLNQVLDVIYQMGRKFAQVLREVGELAPDLLSKIIKESLALGKKIFSLVGHVVSRTYSAATNMIKAALMAGVKAAELLANIAESNYWKLRKIVTGVLSSLGPVGDVLDWTLSKGEGLTGTLWRETLGAIRYAGGSLTDALDWAAANGEAAFTAIVNAWESIGEKLLDVFTWAAKQTNKAYWFVIGQAWTKLANSVGYALTYLEKDFLPGVRKFVEGMIKAGATVGTFAAEFANHTVKLVTEVVKTLLELGHTLGDLMIETAKHPKDAMKNFLQAAKASGQSMEEIADAGAKAGEDVAHAAVDAWRELKVSAKEILNAALEVGLGAVGAYFSHLLLWYGIHRPLNDDEMAAAEAVFGKSIDLDRVLVSVLNLPVELVELCNEQRPFTTNYVLNFAFWKEAKPQTVIHELTHVWQSVEEGPFYMYQAIHAQAEFGKEKVYNYGFPDNASGKSNGEGGQQALLAANGNFDSFNREQQGRIIEHYYVRRFLNGYPAKTVMDAAGNPVRSYEEWQPYADAVHA